jgi:hypothetical protein
MEKDRKIEMEEDEVNDWITPQVTRYEPEEEPTEEPDTGVAAPGARSAEEQETDEFIPQRDQRIAKRSRLEEIFRPNGHWNKRLIFGVLGALLVFAMFGLGGGSKSQKQTESKTQPAKTLKEPQERAGSVMQYSGAEEQTLGTPGSTANRAVIPSEGEATTTTSQHETPAPLRAPLPAATPAAPTRAEPSEKEKPEPTEEEFAMVLRAGEKAERDERAAEKEAERLKSLQKNSGSTNSKAATVVKDTGVLPRTRIELSLTEPLRSGIATSVEARVLSDVRDGQGTVILPAGSTAVLPFLAYEMNGRMVSNSNESALFITPTGQQITLRGIVKGIDGFVGLTGKVKKIGGRSTAGRIIGGIVRAGTRTAADAVGDVSSEAENEINRSTYDSRFPQFERSSRIVEVASGTRFIFVTGR